MSQSREFEAKVLVHLDAAYNLARWLVRDAAVAEDLVQDACVRAFRYFKSLQGDAGRAWFLAIVRNTCFTWLAEQRQRPEHVELDETVMDSEAGRSTDASSDPLAALDGQRKGALIDAAIKALAPPLREVIVLREIEGLAYAEIAQVASIPVGTVMSRLSRARELLRMALMEMGRES